MGIAVFPRQWTQKPPLSVQLARGHALANGLIFAALLNEGGGIKARDLVALAGSQMDGTLSSGATWGSDGVAFDGTANARLACGSAMQTFGTGNFSVFAIAQETLGQTNEGDIVSRGTPTFTHVWDLTFSGTAPVGAIQFQLYDGANNMLATGAADLRGTGWHSFGAVKQPSGAGGLTVYTDGVQVANLATYTIGTYDGSDALMIGRKDGLATGLGGGVRVVYIWNRALTAGEVRTLHEAPYQILVPPLY